ncbi:trimeric intracellular cation channel family protein [Propionivibrio limicola]|uniref:trimeric intracellular cation channel family protein n=1 Tax=Propionivibrio limicola TaxID=167645 RepID=UPI0012914659|nr:trimeric intracellular cation channel family protein [Propionivibrio limicola]
MNLFKLVEAVGVFAFALSGLIEARRRDMDLVGLFVVALVAAFGGGTLRDLLLDRTPLFWIEHDIYAIAILGLATFFALVPATGRFPQSFLLIADALGLGLFSIAGAGYALEAGTSTFIAALMGTITGTFGGVIRDVLCNELPSLFQQTPLYATCAFVGCYFYFWLSHLPLPGDAAAWITIAGITALRLASVRWNWVLPVSRH